MIERGGDTVTYNAFYNALVANSSGDATDTSAIASLGGGAHVNDPVTTSPQITTESTLASDLGIGPQSRIVLPLAVARLLHKCQPGP